ncbi:MAG: hypothetical protein EPN26_10825, partial [Rhodospirillales bacterium]
MCIPATPWMPRIFWSPCRPKGRDPLLNTGYTGSVDPLSGGAMKISFLSDLLQTIVERGRALAGLVVEDVPADGPEMVRLCETLLTSLGEASGVALAERITQLWELQDSQNRLAFLTALAEGFGPDRERLDQALAAYDKTPCQETMVAVHGASEPRRQELIRRLNQAPGGIACLVGMRQELLSLLSKHPELGLLDRDFEHLFASWFNRGFLVLQRIDWDTPASILEKIIRYEAVHAINDWSDLRHRLEPVDRRCFAFFHPQLPGDPLIFVEVALSDAISGDIGEVLNPNRTHLPADKATTAVFYSISNCQDGLRGISFGNFLIKQVVEVLSRELPNLSAFVTLSPVPGFAAWLSLEMNREDDGLLSDDERATLGRILNKKNWADDDATREEFRRLILPVASRYFLLARTRDKRIVDPVARFHLSNGARLERLNFM